MSQRGLIRLHASDRLGGKASIWVRPADTIRKAKALFARKLRQDP